MPVAVLEKGKQPGSHLLSGAVVNPTALRTLFRGRLGTADMPFLTRVHGEGVYYLTRRRALRIPAPPTMRNHGNFVVSVSELGRFLAVHAEEGGALILPETVGEKLLVTGGRVVGVRTGDKGRGRDGEVLGNYEPGSDIAARATVLAEGTQGHLTGVALDRFGLQGESPQVWALGVKEVWRVPTPLRRVIHTLGWPLRNGKRYREFGGSFVYPMGDDMVTLGMVVGMDYRDVELSVHDLLQELKTHKLIRKIISGGERLAWGAKTIPEGGLLALPSRLHGPGVVFCGDAAGLVNVPALKGIHYAVESGRLAAEAVFATLQGGETAWRPGALERYDESLQSSFVWKDMRAVRNMRPAFAKGFWRGSMKAGVQTVTKGNVPRGDARLERDAEVPLIRTNRAARYPAPDGTVIFDKLSSVYASGNRTRDDQPNHIRISARCPSRWPSCGRACARRRSTRWASRTATARSRCRSPRRTASSAARSPPRAGASRRPRAVPAPSTRSPDPHGQLADAPEAGLMGGLEGAAGLVADDGQRPPVRPGCSGRSRKRGLQVARDVAEANNVGAQCCHRAARRTVQRRRPLLHPGQR